MLDKRKSNDAKPANLQQPCELRRSICYSIDDMNLIICYQSKPIIKQTKQEVRFPDSRRP